MADKFSFPKGFLWGASTSAHQVEGGNHNDWSEWEELSADLHAKTANGKQWPDFLKERYPSPLERVNYISGKSCDHYHRFQEDFDIAKSLGHNAHRFSIEWSRVEPEEGKFDEKEIEHYRRVIISLRERGLEPFVTLWHWTVPVWVRDRGGVHAQDFPHYFAKYAEKVLEELGSDVLFWIILNEPDVYAGNAYFRGLWPPQKRGLVNFFRTTYSLNLAHQQAYRLIKAKCPNALIGIAVNMSYFESAGGPVNNLLKRAADGVWNRRFLWHVQNELDFIGLNYYFHNRINYGFNKNENTETSDIGWEIFPAGLYQTLRTAGTFKKPLYVTENGLADVRDIKRAHFIHESLAALLRAVHDGADVRGYFHWSLLDNFEWDKGFWPRFGLVEVDYKTLERHVRPSALEYKKIIALNSIEI